MELGLAIVTASLAVVVVVILSIIIYHQMLLINEVNKRLLLLTKESIEKERITMEELQSTIHSQMETAPKGLKLGEELDEQEDTNEEPFDPHAYEQNLK